MSDPKREILNPDDSPQSLSDDPADRAEAHARAARRLREEEERKKREEEDRRLGWHGRLWRRFKAFWLKRIAGPFAGVYDIFARRFPRAAGFIAGVAFFVARVWLTMLWPVIDRVSHKTDAKGERKLSWIGKGLITAAVLVAVWPVFKIYYVLGTTRDFHDVQITFKQIIDHDRYLVFGDYPDEAQPDVVDNMAFNITDSWVYWNWTPDLMFAQVPIVGTCDFRTYGWYIRVPRFVPFVGRTMLVEPVVIQAACKGRGGLPTGPQT